MQSKDSGSFDIIVIGAGIAGASAAAHLAEANRVLLLEMEERPGYHTTGRSAAAYEPNYGPAPIRALTRAAFGHFDKGGFITPRESLFVMPEGQEQDFDKLMALQQGMEEISPALARAKFPLMREDYAKRVLCDPGTADIDVDLLHQSYLRLFKERGGALLCANPVTGLQTATGWTVETPGHTFSTRIIVNAAGAWGDHVATIAGVRPVGLQPKRRSIAVVPVSSAIAVMKLPFICDAGETWYCKPQGGKFLVSPADATPVEPHDAFADDMALAEGIDRFQQAVDVEVTRVDHSWGGLRTFAPDGNPVVGYDPEREGFFWLVGQGGYGIQTSPALSRLAAALVMHKAPPTDVLDQGLKVKDLSPGRETLRKAP